MNGQVLFQRGSVRKDLLAALQVAVEQTRLARLEGLGLEFVTAAIHAGNELLFHAFELLGYQTLAFA